MRKPSPFVTRACGLGVVLVWSTCFVAIKGTEGAAPPLLYAAARALLAALPLLLLAAARGKLWPARGGFPWLITLGLANTTFGLAGMFLSVELAGAALPAVLANSQALLVAPLAAGLFGEELTGRGWAGLALGFGGVGLILLGGTTGLEGSLTGLLLGLMAAVGLAAGNLIIKHLGSKMDALTAVAWQFAFGGAGLLVWSLATESPSVDWSNPRLLTGLVYLALVGSAGASWVWYRLLQNDDLIPLNSLTLLTPSLSVVLAWLLYRETIPLSAWLGIVATLLGVAVVSLPNRRDQSGGSSSMVEDETGRRRYG